MTQRCVYGRKGLYAPLFKPLFSCKLWTLASTHAGSPSLSTLYWLSSWELTLDLFWLILKPGLYSYTMLSQSWHYWYFGLDNSLYEWTGVISCILRSLAASLILLTRGQWHIFPWQSKVCLDFSKRPWR